MEIKESHKKIIDIKELLILQIMPRQVHSWWPCLKKCRHLSINEAAVDSRSLAIIDQCFNDLGFSYISQHVDGLGSL